jgi:phage terminase large subunit GpA-like protein
MQSMHRMTGRTCSDPRNFAGLDGGRAVWTPGRQGAAGHNVSSRAEVHRRGYRTCDRCGIGALLYGGTRSRPRGPRWCSCTALSCRRPEVQREKRGKSTGVWRKTGCEPQDCARDCWAHGVLGTAHTGAELKTVPITRRRIPSEDIREGFRRFRRGLTAATAVS